MSESERVQYLNEISGRYAPMTQKILELYKKDESFDLLEKNAEVLYQRRVTI